MFRLHALILLVVAAAAWRENQAGPAESSSFEWAVNQSAQYVPEPCSAAVGRDFWTALKSSRTRACNSLVEWDHLGFGAVLLENASLTSFEDALTDWDTPFVDSRLHVDLDCPDSLSRPALSRLGESWRSVGTLSEHACNEWNPEPLVIVPWFDSANWWHFVEMALMPTFLYVGIAQRELLAASRLTQIATLRWPAVRQYNNRTRGVYPKWVALPELLERLLGNAYPLRVVPLEPMNKECYSRVLWMRQLPRHLRIEHLIPKIGTDCYSPIVRAMADHVRASCGVVQSPLPTKTYRRKIHIAFMARDNNTWTRHQEARNVPQDVLLQRLTTLVRGYGCALEVMHFYYRDMIPAREQVQRIARTHIIMGVHGAGLAGMIALPPDSAVVEIRSPDPNIHFHALASLLGHSYYRANMHFSGSPDDVDKYIWPTLKTAIDETWTRHPNLREPHYLLSAKPLELNDAVPQ